MASPIEQQNEPSTAEGVRGGYQLSWARVISDVLSPPVVWAALAIPIALRDAPDRGTGWAWAADYIVLVCLIPIVYIGWMVKLGRITDMHLKVRRQRLLPFAVSISGALAALLSLSLLDASPVMLLFALFTLIQLALIAAITLTWQISVHAMSISGAVVAAGVLFAPVMALLVLPLVVIVGAARIHLKRHTLSQVVAGTVAGMVVPALLFALVSV